MADFKRWRNEVVSSEITRNRLDFALDALIRLEALSHDEELIRAFAIDRYAGSPEDQSDAVADLIARVLAGEEI